MRDKKPRVRLSMSPRMGAALLEIAEAGLSQIYPDHEYIAPQRATEPAHKAVLRLRALVASTHLQTRERE